MENKKDITRNKDGLIECHFRTKKKVYYNEKDVLSISKICNDEGLPAYELKHCLHSFALMGADTIKIARRLSTINKVAAKYGVVFIEAKQK